MNKFANFEVEFELTGLKIHVKGDREIAPIVANNVGRHFAAVLSPAGLIEAPKNGHVQPMTIDADSSPVTRKRTRKSGRASSSSAAADSPITWTHDPSRWGSPVQTWKPFQKIAWLLRVVEQEIGKADLSAAEIADIFQARFKDAGLIVKRNIARDVGGKAELFGSLDGRFFLKQSGKELADKLVTEAKGGAVAA